MTKRMGDREVQDYLNTDHPGELRLREWRAVQRELKRLRDWEISALAALTSAERALERYEATEEEPDDHPSLDHVRRALKKAGKQK